ncbi:TetR-like C-terminal domain-containing protein [Paenarthrobacter aurescens]|uniref:TetR family transcriptional regulator n=1 Tax=Paenarthrobacter aurescens TaxID=43663 RepID=A0A4Y3NCF5_PAEAU|nr:TetR-like C-terminal domain-containing protein [Paenarthrobacter aurescens]MDO6142378.1 WHG domain-containing protein [Paenarthrobacter aurescens]MDO6146225.1 WHG domain-containing protein [Paenarthrobacter aurescens]MDO6157470.1 WHG domain-containing protein [Paenarthrobacter aurescens]MDO6161455.1 WHG domain-containing protein [Paenarthrobacter aurescens]GEB18903.1 TetR family transcriptional regulator [Paenarthrobacter aurescens]
MARPVIHDQHVQSRLLAVTAELVDREGPARVTLRDVAAAAGTSTTAIYSLFGGKAQLLTAAVDHGFRSFGDSQREAAKEGLLGLGRAYRAWALEHTALYRLMFGGALSAYVDCSPTPEVASESMLPLVEAVVTAQRAGALRMDDPTLVAMAIWGQVHGLVSLELAQMNDPATDWAAIYEAALDSVARAWVASPGS